MTNIAKILKNAPKGLKLYSPIFGKSTLLRVKKDEIEIHKCEGNPPYYFYYLDNAGIYHPDGECVLFPSKEHKSWDNWQEVLFQRGDVVTCTKDINQKDKTFIITGIGGNFIALNNNKNLSHNNTSLLYRYATPEEREQFMAELNANGYKWNADTKQIEKIEQQYTPKHKVGDWIKFNDSLCEITNIEDYRYELFYYSTKDKVKMFINETDTNAVTATEQELIDAGIKEKPFTIDDFKTFDKVLCRCKGEYWGIEFFEKYDDGKYYCLSCRADYCIPYNDETKHLIGTDDNCPDKYKTW